MGQINTVTLGVKDIDTLVDWYREKFRWIPVRKHDGSALFRLNGISLLLVQVNDLASNVCMWQDGQGFKRFALTIGFNSETEVNRVFKRLQQDGVMIIREPEKISNGIYRGYIADPEDNFWELGCYPPSEWHSFVSVN